MAEEREYVTSFQLLRWAVPTVVVLLGVVLYFLYHSAAPAIGSALPSP